MCYNTITGLEVERHWDPICRIRSGEETRVIFTQGRQRTFRHFLLTDNSTIFEDMGMSLVATAAACRPRRTLAEAYLNASALQSFLGMKHPELTTYNKYRRYWVLHLT